MWLLADDGLVRQARVVQNRAELRALQRTVRFEDANSLFSISSCPSNSSRARTLRCDVVVMRGGSVCRSSAACSRSGSRSTGDGIVLFFPIRIMLVAASARAAPGADINVYSRAPRQTESNRVDIGPRRVEPGVDIGRGGRDIGEFVSFIDQG